ncbi:hypothetical protein DPMN_142504 [Dreissena polymorpha]|uniref:Uncharacterized protein n=1 Tax=Dreissena polymorpha TaxID=45954 RepID=A0A9D4JNJ0_DREPO|nr:hypothetical protein DPMN_142504 [Dreissena polymorpha]
MACSTNLFSEKETNNCMTETIALRITKEGLTDFIETDMRKVHTAVGRNCGKCAIENKTCAMCNPKPL